MEGLARFRRVIFKRKAHVNHCGEKKTNKVNSNRILLGVSYIFIKGNVISEKKKKKGKEKKNQYIVAET